MDLARPPTMFSSREAFWSLAELVEFPASEDGEAGHVSPSLPEPPAEVRPFWWRLIGSSFSSSMMSLSLMCPGDSVCRSLSLSLLMLSAISWRTFRRCDMIWAA